VLCHQTAEARVYADVAHQEVTGQAPISLAISKEVTGDVADPVAETPVAGGAPPSRLCAI